MKSGRCAVKSGDGALHGCSSHCHSDVSCGIGVVQSLLIGREAIMKIVIIVVHRKPKGQHFT